MTFSPTPIHLWDQSSHLLKTFNSWHLSWKTKLKNSAWFIWKICFSLLVPSYINLLLSNSSVIALVRTLRPILYAFFGIFDSLYMSLCVIDLCTWEHEVIRLPVCKDINVKCIFKIICISYVTHVTQNLACNFTYIYTILCTSSDKEFLNRPGCIQIHSFYVMISSFLCS